MDAPPLQLTQTPDGESLAYWTGGSGPALVVSYGAYYPSVAEHWHVPEFRTFYERLAEHWTVVAYDLRGHGSSSGEHSDEPDVADLEELRQSTGFDQLTLLGVSPGGELLLHYALAHAARVARVILWSCTASGPPQPYQFLFPMQDEYPRLFHETRLLWRGWNEKTSRDQMIRLSLADRVWGRARDRRAWDLQGAALEDVTVPVDIVFSRDSELDYGESARLIASRIPGARLIGMQRQELDPHLGEIDSVIDFFDSIRPAAVEPGSAAPGDSLRTILFTDVVGSTPLLAQLKDAKMCEVMRDHDSILQAAVDEHGGRTVKEIGDGFMVDFALPSAAVDCAIAMQRGVRE